MPTLDWIGKQAVRTHHREVPFHLLRSDPELSVGDPGAGNLLVEGDNLVALKALLPDYAGKVKCIYIDPPYNTGNENWVYNDNVNRPEMRQWLGRVVGPEAADLSRHDKWLCMMYPRLALLRELLTEDGAIFVSVDDNEISNLRLLMDEIFGAANCVATLVWEKGKKGDAKLISVTHEYVLAYARHRAQLTARGVRWRRRKEGIDEVLEQYRALRSQHAFDHATIRKEMMSWYRSLPSADSRKSHKHHNWSDDRGLYFAADFAGPDDGRENRPRYDINHPITGKPCAKPSTGWRWESERTQAALAESPARIHFGPDESTIPCRKSYLAEVDHKPMPSVFYKDGRAATLEVESLLGPGAFAFPKDSEIRAPRSGPSAGARLGIGEPPDIGRGVSARPGRGTRPGRDRGEAVSPAGVHRGGSRSAGDRDCVPDQQSPEVRRPGMKLNYDPGTDTLTLELRSAPVAESDEDKPGVILDYDAQGNLVGLEILDASRRVEEVRKVAFEVGK